MCAHSSGIFFAGSDRRDRSNGAEPEIKFRTRCRLSEHSHGRSGIHPCYIGELPPQCAALNRTNINVQELAMLAAIEKEKTLVYQALLLDPLTSALLTIEETRQMVDELFDAEHAFLHEFK